MSSIFFFYVIGLFALATSLVAATAAFGFFYIKGRDYAKREARLPLATRYEDLQHRVNDIEVERDRLQDELNAAKETIREAAAEREWLINNEELVKKMREEREDLERVQQEHAKALDELAAIKNSIDEHKEKEQKLAFDTFQIQKELELATERLNDSKRDIEKNDARLKELDATVAERETKRDELVNELRSLQSEVAQEKSRLDALSQEYKDVQNKLAGLQEDLKKAENAAELADARHRELSSQNAAMEGVISGLESKQRSLESALSTLSRQVPGGEVNPESLSELWVPVIDAEEFPAGESEEEESTALNRAKDYLRELDLVFPDRVVNAFHTSLKVSLESPLLVLAGISGTGKSLLPRRYAEAMGMHFLPIPVQPRWDGPQDLLGFFNYLEGVYKSTELARALIQMDTQEQGWYPDERQSTADRMLLVLLDEMNLARVEYYFSEFLSRLESRRDVLKIRDRADRSKAELILDVGRSADGDLSMGHVYPAENVKFVGTMNEDESTLALSDKVIDRANVLRFGRPPQRNRSTHNTHSEREHRSKAWLSHATWQNWKDAREDTVLPDLVGDTIRNLNDAMSAIGRPFGYRMQRAIEAYVRHYPTDHSEATKVALADQIEQRIMPRLRGLDLGGSAADRAIQEIDQIVRELGDTELSDAITRGRQAADGHLFAWMGVERSLEA